MTSVSGGAYSPVGLLRVKTVASSVPLEVGVVPRIIEMDDACIGLSQRCTVEVAPGFAVVATLLASISVQRAVRGHVPVLVTCCGGRTVGTVVSWTVPERHPPRFDVGVVTVATAADIASAADATVRTDSFASVSYIQAEVDHLGTHGITVVGTRFSVDGKVLFVSLVSDVFRRYRAIVRALFRRLGVHIEVFLRVVSPYAVASGLAHDIVVEVPATLRCGAGVLVNAAPPGCTPVLVMVTVTARIPGLVAPEHVLPCHGEACREQDAAVQAAGTPTRTMARARVAADDCSQHLEKLDGPSVKLSHDGSTVVVSYASSPETAAHVSARLEGFPHRYVCFPLPARPGIRGCSAGPRPEGAGLKLEDPAAFS